MPAVTSEYFGGSLSTFPSFDIGISSPAHTSAAGGSSHSALIASFGFHVTQGNQRNAYLKPLRKLCITASPRAVISLIIPYNCHNWKQHQQRAPFTFAVIDDAYVSIYHHKHSVTKGLQPLISAKKEIDMFYTCLRARLTIDRDVIDCQINRCDESWGFQRCFWLKS
jgi:hypothetical protein